MLLLIYTGGLFWLESAFDRDLSQSDHRMLLWLWLNAGCVCFMIALKALGLLVVRACAGFYFKFLIISWAVNYCLLLFMLGMGYWTFWQNFRVSRTANEEDTGTFVIRVTMFLTLQLNLLASFYFIFWAVVLTKGLKFMKQVKVAVTKFKADFEF